MSGQTSFAVKPFASAKVLHSAFAEFANRGRPNDTVGGVESRGAESKVFYRGDLRPKVR